MNILQFWKFYKDMSNYQVRVAMEINIELWKERKEDRRKGD